MMTIVLFIVIAYLIGAIPCGVILTRLAGGEDVRKSGSGNIGATNVYRVAGRKLGVVTLLLDTLKGVIPVLIAVKLFPDNMTAIALVAAATFLGHLFPVYIGFKGGKGVATALGIFLVLSPLAILIALILFVAVVWQWRYISLGSIIAAAACPFLIALVENSFPLFLAGLFIGGMVIYRHRANIQRLREGTENKFTL